MVSPMNGNGNPTRQVRRLREFLPTLIRLFYQRSGKLTRSGRLALPRSSLPPGDDAAALYLDLMKLCLTNSVYGELVEPDFDPALRMEGFGSPAVAHTMIGMKRLDNIQSCVTSVLSNGVPGDLIETGVWRGGATIFMRAILKAYGVRDRRVWVADSFAGLPPPDAEQYPQDQGDLHYTNTKLAVPLEEVRENFARYHLLDDQVHFLKGWFRETLPEAPIEQLSVLRLDGDMYESTMDALRHLYPRVSTGGFIIVDDYALPGCRAAIRDYRCEHNIADKIEHIDLYAAYWQRS
jgi:O-methyltransferase